MTRAELEHLYAPPEASPTWRISSSCQAVPGEFPDAPAELLVSNEADVFPLR